MPPRPVRIRLSPSESVSVHPIPGRAEKTANRGRARCSGLVVARGWAASGPAPTGVQGAFGGPAVDAGVPWTPGPLRTLRQELVGRAQPCLAHRPPPHHDHNRNGTGARSSAGRHQEWSAIRAPQAVVRAASTGRTGTAGERSGGRPRRPRGSGNVVRTARAAGLIWPVPRSPRSLSRAAKRAGFGTARDRSGGCPSSCCRPSFVRDDSARVGVFWS